jgi:hypothetical protein
MKFNLWNTIAVGVFLIVVDSIAVSNLASNLQDFDGYEQLCVMDKLSDGMVANMLVRKADKEITIENNGLYKYLYAERAIRKAMDKC